MKFENLITILLSILIGYLLYLVMAPFFTPIFWAVVFVILFYPYYKWLLRKVSGKKGIASFLACLTIALFLITPLVIFGVILGNEFLNLYQWAENYMAGIQTRAHDSPLFIYPLLEKYLGGYIDVSKIDLHSIFANTVREVAGFLGDSLKGFVKNFAEFMIDLALSFITMFFLFRDGEGLLGLIKDLIPISEKDKQRIMKENRDVIQATMYGGVLVGLVQGALGGIAFWFLGLPAPVLWGFIMFLFSFLPSVGSAIIWGPAAVYLLVTGNYTGGVILILWGVLVIGLVDNLLRPFIVSGKTHLHPMLLFFSILGAVNVFGFIGIIAGPLILSVGQTMVNIYHSYLKNRNTWAG